MKQHRFYKTEMTFLAKAGRVVDRVPDAVVYSIIAALTIVTITLTLMEL